MPLDELNGAVSKASVPLDSETLMKHFYMWKEMTKNENLPLPPCERILPMQDAFWNKTKHGSDMDVGECALLRVDGCWRIGKMQRKNYLYAHKSPS